MAVGLLGVGVFFVLVSMAVQGEIRVRRGELGETRVWLIREEKDRGLGISTMTVVSGSESSSEACAETRVRFLMLVAEQEREPLTYCECFAKVGEEPLRISLMLEPGDKVVGIPHDDHVTVCVPASPLPDPPVEDVMEVARVVIAAPLASESCG